MLCVCRWKRPINLLKQHRSNVKLKLLRKLHNSDGRWFVCGLTPIRLYWVCVRGWMRGHWLLYISQEFVHANTIIQCRRKFGVRNISSKSIYGFNAMPIVQRVILRHTNVVDAVVHIHTVYTVAETFEWQHTDTHVCRGVNYEMVSQNCNTGRVGRRRHHHYHVGHLFNVHSFNRCTDVSHFSQCLNTECIFQHLFHHLMLIQCGFDLQCSSRIIRMYYSLFRVSVISSPLSLTSSFQFTSNDNAIPFACRDRETWRGCTQYMIKIFAMTSLYTISTTHKWTLIDSKRCQRVLCWAVTDGVSVVINDKTKINQKIHAMKSNYPHFLCVCRHRRILWIDNTSFGSLVVCNSRSAVHSTLEMRENARGKTEQRKIFRKRNMNSH